MTKKTADGKFSLGDIVYMKNFALKQGINRKFQKKFLGPYYIVKKIGDASYEIKEVYGRKTEQVHSDRLRKALKPGASFSFDYEDTTVGKGQGEQINDENVKNRGDITNDSDSSESANSPDNIPIPLASLAPQIPENDEDELTITAEGGSQR